jgi:hypothetical protein
MHCNNRLVEGIYRIEIVLLHDYYRYAHTNNSTVSEVLYTCLQLYTIHTISVCANSKCVEVCTNGIYATLTVGAIRHVYVLCLLHNPL